MIDLNNYIIKYYDYNIEYVQIIIKILIKMITDNESIEFKRKENWYISRYTLFYFPGFNLLEFKNYIKLICKRFNISIPHIILCSYYIHKYNEKFIITKHKVILIFIASLIVADKYLNDNAYTNRTWSYYIRLSAYRLTTIELEFLKVLDFKIHVTKEDFFEHGKYMYNFLMLNNI